ncbi:metal-sensitive transcriptional regulator [Patescibacteria group bacterium]|nr:metal-sensitive transcriptional regulator [Patescibacteria group bacterium]
MFKPKNHKERIVHRLRIVRGHLDKVIKMNEDGVYCIDVIHQSQAVQKALNKVDNLIMENHLQTCVSDSIKKGNQKEAIAEVMSVLKKNGNG